jgi:L-threonate 2-dehydrogenase
MNTLVKDQRVGIIGLGIMGGAMALNLMERGWIVYGFDLDPARCKELGQAGVAVCDSVADVATKAEVVITSLPTPKALAAVATDIAKGPGKNRIVVETSTMSIDDKLKFGDTLRASGHIPLDCPLSGTGAQARVRDLIVYASGDSIAIKRVMPLFADFSSKAADIGAYGNGSRMKFVANHLVAIHNVASAEAMVLAMKAGLDLGQVVELVGPGAGGSRMFQVRAPMMANNVYEPATMRVSTWQKDMSIIAEFAAGLGVQTPVFSATEAIYDRAMELQLGDQDTAAVCKVIEEMAGVTRS